MKENVNGCFFSEHSVQQNRFVCIKVISRKRQAVYVYYVMLESL